MSTNETTNYEDTTNYGYQQRPQQTMDTNRGQNKLRMSTEEILNCCLCVDLYRDPIQLTCSHSLCRQCLEELKQSSVGTVLPCPECHEIILEQTLQKNEMLASLVDLYREITTRDANHLQRINNPAALQPNTSFQETTNDVTEQTQHLELQLLRLHQVQVQKQMQQDHLQRRLNLLKFKLKQGRHALLNTKSLTQQMVMEQMDSVLKDFENNLHEHDLVLKQQHETQLKSLQLKSTRAAAIVSPEETRPHEQLKTRGSISERTERNHSQKNKVFNSKISNTPKRLSQNTPTVIQSKEVLQVQLEHELEQLNQSYQESHKNNEQIRLKIKEIKNSSNDKSRSDTLVHLKQFEEKFQHYETLRENIHTMKLSSIQQKLDKIKVII